MAKRGKKLDKNSMTAKFITFVINKISGAKGANRNLVMARIIEEFCDKYDAKYHTFDRYSVYIRVMLEQAGYIMYSPLNSIDRRVRFLSPTPKFPLPNQRKKLEKLVSMLHSNFSRVNHGGEYPRSLTV